MKAEYANPFVVAAVQTFQKEIGVRLSRKDLKLKDSPVPSQAISIIIGVTGAVRGQFHGRDGFPEGSGPSVEIDTGVWELGRKNIPGQGKAKIILKVEGGDRFARLVRVRRAVALVEEALRGRIFIRRL